MNENVRKWSQGELELVELFQVLLSARLQRHGMNESPVPPAKAGEKIMTFFHSDRARFERTYIVFLCVLVEGWQCFGKARELAASVTSIQRLTDLMRKLKKGGDLHDDFRQMKEVRAYMCHRDERAYWDEGRVGASGGMWLHEEIYEAFFEMFQTVCPALSAASKGEGTESPTS